MSAAVEAVARRYDEAWNARDLDAIVATHHPEGSYHLNVAGLPPVHGREAIRAAFAASLENWRELDFTLVQVLAADGFYVWESEVRGVAARELALGAVTIAAGAGPLVFRGVDVITLDGDGLITTKSTWFDLVAAANQALVAG